LKLLDTTIAIDYLRGRQEAVELLENLLRSERAVSSELVRFELYAGARDEELGTLAAFLSALDWLPVTTEISETAGLLARRYRASFSGTDDIDYLIAASAIVADADLLTTNIRHYPMLEGLEPPY